MIKPQSRVLDLGCGDGELLYLLKDNKQCQGTGVEIDEKAIYECVEKGLTVLHEDIQSSLKDYSDKRFDYVILNESLQQVMNPRETILEALRVGKKVIVGIPNFCQIISRFQIFFFGRVPVTKELPYEWYNTPNVRFFSLKDFRQFCRMNNITIIKERGIGFNKEIAGFKNLLANFGIYLLEQ
ncbi:MAG: methionine biosynthesis protein MetW [Candidatus Omnitrophica bacterium]|nr:methionine biosynthesis protein MetW [Candidatus Omnitrophota bacterium]